MFAAQPPRRTSRSSTRNDSAILSSWSTTRESANRPGKVIRWSVAMEPVTSSDTRGPRWWEGRAANAPETLPAGTPGDTQPQGRGEPRRPGVRFPAPGGQAGGVGHDAGPG